jgi:WD40 repeat protein
MERFVVSPDGRMAFVEGSVWEPAIMVCDLELGEVAPPLRGHKHYESALAISPDGRLLASAALDQSLWMWETASGQPIHIFPKQPSVMAALAFSPDGRVLVTADGSPKKLAYEVPDQPRIRF